MNISILIIDDEDQARRLLRNLILKKYEYATLHEECNILDAVEVIKKNKVDLVISDINMPGHSGLELVDLINRESYDFSLIYTTAFDHYAIEAFKTNAIDYILKPLDEDELYDAIEKALRLQEKNADLGERLKRMLSYVSMNKIKLKIPKGYLFVKPEEIIMFEADGMYTYVHLTGQKKQLISKPLKFFVDQLQDNTLFYRPQRSYLINLSQITEVRKDEALFIVMTNGDSVTVARDKKKGFLSTLDKLF
ncbi:LytR/AlgR family response regulator transcription factor [Nonlabens xiamenensis]|uniref:LytR/AlgR family response regulator transcription factor n=1 Tax=Nonlabens xiamenensis TaxID=2341043 RepID=UPI000F613557|nr:LytTR family DNA-binding domain-containing protein [Nonlabens xiamenensis]